MNIVLASTSRYRHELLSRLHLPFTVMAPHVDETALPHEAPRDTALRLARAKAEVVAAQAPSAIVIGSDQVAALGHTVLGKPGQRKAAIEQLTLMQNQRVAFHTALTVIAAGQAQIDCIDTVVHFRPLERATIEAYVDREQPFDVAGAAKIESLGIALVQSVESTDPTALIGLPLIRLVSMLHAVGIRIPAPV